MDRYFISVAGCVRFPEICCEKSSTTFRETVTQSRVRSAWCVVRKLVDELLRIGKRSTVNALVVRHYT